MKKPPLGLVARFIVVESRIEDIEAAISRYAKAELRIPYEWLKEYTDLVEWLEDYRKTNK